MKTTLLLLALTICPSLYAQYESYYATKKYKPYDRYWQMDFSLGANMDLTHSSSDANAFLLNTRKDVAPSFTFRASQLFSKRFGWFSTIQINFYKNQSYQEQSDLGAGLEKVLDRLTAGLTWWRPSFDAGLLYRIEWDKWRIHPWVGIGYQYHMSEKNSHSTVSSGSEVTSKYHFTQRPSNLYLNIGTTVSYFISDRSYLILRAGFRQPLQKSKVELDRFEDGETKEYRYYETWTAGRSLDLSLGYGFTFGKR